MVGGIVKGVCCIGTTEVSVYLLTILKALEFALNENYTALNILKIY
jgi:hypothetical protein